jgi:hypothetical protein
MRNILASLSFALLFVFAAPAAPVLAQDAIKQMQLTEKQVQGYVAAQKELTALSEKLQGKDGAPDPKMQAQLDAVIKKNGFASAEDFATVADNISLVMSGIDPETKAFSDPKTAIEKEIAEVKGDKEMSPDEKKQALEELSEALKSAEPVKFPGNIELVKKYYEQLDGSTK